MKLLALVCESDAIPKPEHLKDQLLGVSLGEDDDGFYVYTHRCRSDSYASADDIPKSVITYIESTG